MMPGLLRARWSRPAGLGLLVAAVALIPVAAPRLTTVMVEVLLWVLLALGLNVVVGFAGLLDLGYVAFYAIGNYVFAIATAGEYSRALVLRGGADLPPAPVWHDWMWLLIFVGMAAAMVSGVILGAPTLRLRGDYLAIVTLGFGEIVRLTARNLEGVTMGSRGIGAIPHPEVNLPGFHYAFGIRPQGYYYLLMALSVLMVVMIARLNNSKIGRAWTAIREDEVAASAMGVPAVRMKLWAFAIGASTAGVAGVVQASRINYVSPETFALLFSFFALSMVVLGGMGSIPGSILGALVIVAVPELLRSYLPEFQEYRFLVFGAVLMVMMVFRPQGLIPSKRRAIELKGEVRDETVGDLRARIPGGGDGGAP